jgi:MerR family transcriptional regulator, copper efflux regulator
MGLTSSAIGNLLRVGDLARLTGKTVRAIHLYEEMGLLRPATRSSGGFRLYERGVVERVRWIGMLHGLGFSLQEMHGVLQDWWRSDLGPEAMEHLRGLFQAKLDQTRQEIERQRQLELELRQGLAYLETCKVCPTHESVRGCVSCSQDHGMEHEPALLAGISSVAEGGSAFRARGRAREPGFVPLEHVGTRQPGARSQPEERLVFGKELDSR